MIEVCGRGDETLAEGEKMLVELRDLVERWHNWECPWSKAGASGRCPECLFGGYLCDSLAELHEILDEDGGEPV